MKRQRRIELTGEILRHFFREVFSGEVSEFSAHKGLPYGLIYNLVHGRINSISAVDYRRIFGEDPPAQEPKRVNGRYFRGMVRLWLFLNEGITEKELYHEFYSARRSVKKTDYRIFSGLTKSVERRLEQIMEQKFLDQGLSTEEIERWIRELDLNQGEGRVPFPMVQPVLNRLEKSLKVHPSRLLNRWVAAYESGGLKTIDKKLYRRLLELDRKAQEVLVRPSRLGFEKLREEIYGSRKGFVLFSEIEEELEFLKAWGRKSPKRYLGRSPGKYKRGKLKRLAHWRERKVREECERLILEKPLIPLKALPRRYREKTWMHLAAMLQAVLVAKMLSRDKVFLEEEVLNPVYHTKKEYESGGYGFVNVQEAARILGMSERAFGLLMAAHSNIFKRIGKYEGSWLIPDLYLSEISQKRAFLPIKGKYEWLARRKPNRPVSPSLRWEDRQRAEPASEYADAQGPQTLLRTDQEGFRGSMMRRSPALQETNGKIKKPSQRSCGE
jgi:hypothetical protein